MRNGTAQRTMQVSERGAATTGPGLDGLDGLAERAATCARAQDRVGAAGELAVELAGRIPLPGEGRTAELWSVLATLGSVDLVVARVVEPHVDARTILRQAGLGAPGPAGLLGVYAAEGHGHRLTARRAGPTSPDEWLLEGSKPWCSLADRVDGFLVTAWVDEDRRGLFAVDRRALTGTGADGALTVDDAAWHARGLSEIPSPETRYRSVPATAVGEPGWYLARPGFAWGGIGVAAVWFGAAVSLARRVASHARARTPDQVAHLHVGRVETAVHRARCVLAAAAADVDDGRAGGAAGARLALTVRAVVRDAAEEVLREAAHAMGPAPLVAEAEHAQRVADLQVYLRQEHAERDAAALGREVLRMEPEPEPAAVLLARPGPGPGHGAGEAPA
jgi:alkylation response protein AidB-like acyl-CoA dehydrogenase